MQRLVVLVARQEEQAGQALQVQQEVVQEQEQRQEQQQEQQQAALEALQAEQA